MAALSEIIEWFRVDEALPAACAAVLVVVNGSVDERYGHMVGAEWRDSDGFFMNSPEYWAYPPEGPAR